MLHLFDHSMQTHLIYYAMYDTEVRQEIQESKGCGKEDSTWLGKSLDLQWRDMAPDAKVIAAAANEAGVIDCRSTEQHPHVFAMHEHEARESAVDKSGKSVEERRSTRPEEQEEVLAPSASSLIAAAEESVPRKGRSDLELAPTSGRLTRASTRRLRSDQVAPPQLLVKAWQNNSCAFDSVIACLAACVETAELYGGKCTLSRALTGLLSNWRGELPSHDASWNLKMLLDKMHRCGATKTSTGEAVSLNVEGNFQSAEDVLLMLLHGPGMCQPELRNRLVRWRFRSSHHQSDCRYRRRNNISSRDLCIDDIWMDEFVLLMSSPKNFQQQLKRCECSETMETVLDSPRIIRVHVSTGMKAPAAMTLFGVKYCMRSILVKSGQHFVSWFERIGQLYAYDGMEHSGYAVRVGGTLDEQAWQHSQKEDITAFYCRLQPLQLAPPINLWHDDWMGYGTSAFASLAWLDNSCALDSLVVCLASAALQEPSMLASWKCEQVSTIGSMLQHLIVLSVQQPGLESTRDLRAHLLRTIRTHPSSHLDASEIFARCIESSLALGEHTKVMFGASSSCEKCTSAEIYSTHWVGIVNNSIAEHGDGADANALLSFSQSQQFKPQDLSSSVLEALQTLKYDRSRCSCAVDVVDWPQLLVLDLTSSMCGEVPKRLKMAGVVYELCGVACSVIGKSHYVALVSRRHEGHIRGFIYDDLDDGRIRLEDFHPSDTNVMRHKGFVATIAVFRRLP